MKELEQKVFEAIEARRDELCGLLSKLVQINSENFAQYGNEKECSEYIGTLLDNLGMNADIYSPDSLPGIKDHFDYLAGRGLENRPNVTGVMPGRDGKRRVMFAAHVDTRPIGNINNWTFPPLGGTIDQGRIIGRGACDDKYGLATVIFLLGLFKDMGITLSDDIGLTGYIDEEFGGGDGALACCLKYPSDLFVNLDGKNFEINHCGVGGGEICVDIHAKDAVDSCSLVADGLYEIKKELFSFKENRRAEIAAVPYFADTIIPNTSMRIMEMRVGDEGSDMDKGHMIFTYYTVSDEQQIKAELDEMAERIGKKLDEMGLVFDGFTPHTRFFRYAASDKDGEAIQAMDAASVRVSGEKLHICGSCLSDNSIFIRIGKQGSFSFGAGQPFDVYGGTHQADEFIHCDSLVRFAKIIASFMIDYCGGAQ